MHNNQKAEATQIRVDGLTDKQNVADTYNGIYLSLKNVGDSALASLAQRLEPCPADQRVPSSVPARNMYQKNKKKKRRKF